MRIPVYIQTEDGKVKGFMPTSWSDISVRTFFRLIEWSANDGQNGIRCYSILTGLSEEILRRCSNLSLDVEIDRHTAFMLKPAPFTNMRLPKTMKIMSRGLTSSRDVVVPTDLWVKELSQKMAMDKFMSSIGMDSAYTELKKTSYAVAVWMYQEIIGGDFDDKKARALADELEDYPAEEMIPISIFFWRACNRLTRNGKELYSQNKSRRNWLLTVADYLNTAISKQ